jgi:endogenous inhibitor of DNA gyrase (YacG/DUF329 family)
MLQLPKNKIAELRGIGFSYAKIAEALKVSENTIQSFCRRNGLGGVRTANAADLRLCAQCSAPLVTTINNKTKRFCSAKCRSDWWNAHPERGKGRRLETQDCPHCGKPFRSYGSRNRKYCCHACYIAARFGGKDNVA